MYKKIVDKDNVTVLAIYRESDGASIPLVMDNRDYVAFVNYLAQNNISIDDIEVL